MTCEITHNCYLTL